MRISKEKFQRLFHVACLDYALKHGYDLLDNSFTYNFHLAQLYVLDELLENNNIDALLRAFRSKLEDIKLKEQSTEYDYKIFEAYNIVLNDIATYILKNRSLPDLR